ncbi:MAG: OmpA family protein [Gemmatimonadales bacterium]
MVSALQSAAGDREDLVTVDEVTPEGARYSWSFKEGGAGAGRTEQGRFARFVRIEDLRSAPRLNPVYSSRDPERIPGTTAFSLSTASFRELQANGQTRLSLAEFEGGGLGGLFGGSGLEGLGTKRVYYKGTLLLASPTPVAIPLLINGRRADVAVLHARGTFSLGSRQMQREFWFAADPEHPLMLRAEGGSTVWQVIRVDFPGSASAAAMEGDLERACRAEIPGVYFELGSADLRPESERTLSMMAQLLARHPAWTIAVEGHTDSLGTAASNQALSARRAEAVRDALMSTHRVAPGRLTALGFGATHPRESNGTLEGRARNRRVELVRPCKPTPNSRR